MTFCMFNQRLNMQCALTRYVPNASCGLQPSWKMNDLRAETRQSVESIKKILGNIAVQNTRGPSRGEFELKSEYKTSVTPA